MSFGEVRRSTLAQEIVNRLLFLMQEKQLRPGDRLPAERELAAMMKVSRPSLREALRALALIGVVSIRQGSGTFVTALKPDLLVEHLDVVYALEDATFLQLFETRRLLEVGIVQMAAERATDEDLDELDRILDKTAASAGDHAALLEADMALHERIASMARNPMLSWFMTSVSQLGRASRRRTMELPGVVDQVLENHRTIVAALRTHDPEAARQAMMAHLKNVEGQLKELVPISEERTRSRQA